MRWTLGVFDYSVLYDAEMCALVKHSISLLSRTMQYSTLNSQVGLGLDKIFHFLHLAAFWSRITYEARSRLDAPMILGFYVGQH